MSREMNKELSAVQSQTMDECPGFNRSKAATLSEMIVRAELAVDQQFRIKKIGNLEMRHLLS